MLSSLHSPDSKWKLDANHFEKYKDNDIMGNDHLSVFHGERDEQAAAADASGDQTPWMLKDDWVAAEEEQQLLKDSASAWRDHGQAGVSWYQVILATTNDSARTTTELRHSGCSRITAGGISMDEGEGTLNPKLVEPITSKTRASYTRSSGAAQSGQSVVETQASTVGCCCAGTHEARVGGGII